MNRNVKKFLNKTFIALQVAIFLFALFISSSTMEIFSWYEPLTMGAFFALLVVLPLQAIVSIGLSFSKKKIQLLSSLHLLLLTAMMVCMIMFQNQLSWLMTLVLVVQVIIITFFVKKLATKEN
ncbi:hypothetical protein [Mangrovibacillus cuniculi]|uniref:Uncharacterized protein n=1 Tax=Mangrovibacillus cuniculi TaxID=2593652 RepID=A0A7S8C9I4_9BACI|nr:hypothetical protein [Mangrovibacillus cuniculi]QPC45902.1 hypothetical protein G8O30_02490 [Mangrovibacillus cuniculi]